MSLEKLTKKQYDFIDIGASSGGSLRFAMEKLGGVAGLGIDKDPKKVSRIKEIGYDALELDAQKLNAYKDAVSFVLSFHFFEHLPGYRAMQSILRSATSSARDYMLIRVPWYDSDGWLFKHGLKFYWSDWGGHDFCVSQLDFYRAIRYCNIPARVRFYGRRRVENSRDLAIHPISSPFNQHAYELSMHGPKSDIVIPVEVPTFYELQIIILLSDRYEFRDIEKLLDGEGVNVLSDFVFT